MSRRILFATLALAACSDSANHSNDLAMSDDLASDVDLAGADLTGAPAPDLAGADLAGMVAPLTRLFGGTNFDIAFVTIASPDGYLYVGGQSSSFNGDLMGLKTTVDKDIWILKLDGALNIVWNRTYGGGNDNRPYALALAADGDLVVVSTINGAGRQVTQAFGGTDAWLMKLNQANGDLRWEVTIGGTNDELPRVVRETVLANGGGWEYTVLGYTKSAVGGNVVEPTVGFTDTLIGQYIVPGPNPTPTPMPNPRATTFGGNATEIGIGFLGDSIVGITSSNAGTDVAGTTARGLDDIYIQPPGGTLVRFGGSEHDQIVQLLPDGVFIGATGSNSDEVTCNMGPVAGGLGAIWIGKLTQAGLAQSVCFGSDINAANGIAKLQSGGYIVVGGGLGTNAPGTGPLVVVLDSSLQITKQYHLGGNNGTMRAVAVMADGTAFAVGETGDSTGEFAGNHGSRDVWVAKLTP